MVASSLPARALRAVRAFFPIHVKKEINLAPLLAFAVLGLVLSVYLALASLLR
jgi:hypothetical protein